LWQGEEFSLFLIVQTGYGAHPTSYTMVSQGIKWLRRKADHSPSTSVEVKKTWIYNPLPHIFSWHSAQLVMYRDNFAFYHDDKMEWK
jgi:hypothetical protein